MATLDLSGYRMIAKRSGHQTYIAIRPAMQGAAAVGDTLILREGEAYRVTRVSDPYMTKGGAQDVTLYLEEVR